MSEEQIAEAVALWQIASRKSLHWRQKQSRGARGPERLMERTAADIIDSVVDSDSDPRLWAEYERIIRHRALRSCA